MYRLGDAMKSRTRGASASGAYQPPNEATAKVVRNAYVIDAHATSATSFACLLLQVERFRLTLFV